MSRKPTMETVKRQFKHWREHGKKKARRIPEELWEAAVRLTEEYSISHVAKSLHLCNTTLRDRAREIRGQKRERGAKPDNFVELNLGDVVNGIGVGSEVEVEDTRGWKLRVRGGGVDELVEAVRGVWEKGL